MGAVFNVRWPTDDGIGRVVGFFNGALEVDARGDKRNYPTGNNRIEGTIRSYHPDLFASNEVVTAGEFERRLMERLKAEGIPLMAKDWFVTNIVWEFLMGGGSVGGLPVEWNSDKYLRVNINGKQFGFPTERCVVPWDKWEREEQIFNYRAVTGYKFADTFLRCLGPEFGNIEAVFGAMTIYQIMTDRYHRKNPGEPLFSELVDIIKKRCPYSDWEEAAMIGRMTKIWPLLTMLGTVAAKLVCRIDRGHEEWVRRTNLMTGEF